MYITPLSYPALLTFGAARELVHAWIPFALCGRSQCSGYERYQVDVEISLEAGPGSCGRRGIGHTTRRRNEAFGGTSRWFVQTRSLLNIFALLVLYSSSA